MSGIKAQDVEVDLAPIPIVTTVYSSSKTCVSDANSHCNSTDTITRTTCVEADCATEKSEVTIGCVLEVEDQSYNCSKTITESICESEQNCTVIENLDINCLDNCAIGTSFEYNTYIYKYIGLYIGCCKLENEILKEAKNAQKDILGSQNDHFWSFFKVSSLFQNFIFQLAKCCKIAAELLQHPRYIPAMYLIYSNKLRSGNYYT